VKTDLYVLDVYDECEQFDLTTEDEGNEEGMHSNF